MRSGAPERSGRAVALVDCNNFYVSCERLFHPKLEGQPVVVLSNNDGCIISRSNEAKALGIPMGEPLFKARPTIERHGVRVFSSNYTLYGDLSHRVMETLRQFTPRLERYSIDEAFLDLDGLPPPGQDLTAYARTIRDTVGGWVGIPVSVGVADTKTLAKVANRLAKKSRKAGGTLVLQDPHHVRAALERTQIGDVWGVGRRWAERLAREGVRTAEDFRQLPVGWVRQHLNVVGLRTWKELWGFRCVGIETAAAVRKSVCVSRSFGRLVEALTPLQEAVATFTARAAEKLRRQGLAAGMVAVFIQTDKFKEDEPRYAPSLALALPEATASTLALTAATRRALERIYRPEYRYKKAGVLLLELRPEAQVQYALFGGAANAERDRRLMRAMDHLNGKLGRDFVHLAASRARRTKPADGWVQRRTQLSPCYTTQFAELLTIGSL